MKEANYTFTIVDGVTVVRGPRGRLFAPAVRSYDEPLDIRKVATLWRNQAVRDAEFDPSGFVTGHLGLLVNAEWFCNSTACACRKETRPLRLHRSLGN